MPSYSVSLGELKMTTKTFALKSLDMANKFSCNNVTAKLIRVFAFRHRNCFTHTYIIHFLAVQNASSLNVSTALKTVLRCYMTKESQTRRQKQTLMQSINADHNTIHVSYKQVNGFNRRQLAIETPFQTVFGQCSWVTLAAYPI